MKARSRGMLVAASFATLVVGACVADSPTGVARSTGDGQAASEPMRIRFVLRDGATHAVISGGAQAFTLATGEKGAPTISRAEKIADDAAVDRLRQEFVAHLPAVAAGALRTVSPSERSGGRAVQWAGRRAPA